MTRSLSAVSIDHFWLQTLQFVFISAFFIYLYLVPSVRLSILLASNTNFSFIIFDRGSSSPPICRGSMA